MSDMRQVLDELMHITSELEAKQRYLMECLSHYDRDNEEKSHENNRLKDDIKTLVEYNDKLRNENNSLKDDIKTLEKHIDKLRNENNSLKYEKQELVRTIVENQRNYDKLMESIVVSKEFSVSSFLRRESVSLDEYYGVIGVLFADYDSIPVKEYIADELMLFNSQSAQYIDFLLPGYSYDVPSDSKGCKVDNVFLNGKQLYYDRDAFSRCLLDYRKLFGLDYLDKPVLVLHELNSGKVSPRRIILELDYKEIKKLFDKIIDIAKRHTDLSDFSEELQKKYFFCMLPKFLKMLVSYYLIDIDEVDSTIKGVYRFRIRDK